MHQVSLLHSFEAAHRLMNHLGKCRHLHGHSYKAEIIVQAPSLNPAGMVVDFADLKSLIGKWIDENWDHNILLSLEDPLAKLYISRFDELSSLKSQTNLSMGIFAGKAPFLFFQSPTAEVMSKYLAEETSRLLDSAISSKLIPEIKLVSVKIQETEKCLATYFNS